MAVRFDSILGELRERDLAFPPVSVLPLLGENGEGALLPNGELYVWFGTWQLITTLTPPVQSEWFGGLLFDLPVGQE